MGFINHLVNPSKINNGSVDRKEKIDERELKNKIFELFVKKDRYTMEEFEKELDQPKVSPDEQYI